MKFVCPLMALALLVACQTAPPTEEAPPLPALLVEAETFTSLEGEGSALSDAFVATTASGWIALEVPVETTGRYQAQIRAQAPQGAIFWLEDYADNPDGRTYNITGSIPAPADTAWRQLTRDGSPLEKGMHPMRLHWSGGPVEVDWVAFELMVPHQLTPDTLVQATEGEEWELVWSDEFEGSGLPDSSKWTYDLGNWGWGNQEPQYYTVARPENARQEGGSLFIEALRDDMGYPWTSARLTTRGKVSFLYGKIEFRAKVPAGDGTWAAGWLLGDAYRDELSWPYCGEVDILECVGHEIDDRTGDGINHCSCHTRAYYFKQNNHISETIEVEDMVDTFHRYTVEWTPTEIRGYLDDEFYYVYDKTGDALSWPFDQPQTLILNLAMGGGMGGEIDSSLTSQVLEVDYVRVYGRK